MRRFKRLRKRLSKNIATTAYSARAYANYIVRRPSLPPRRFVIFGRGRCGSTLLVSLLDSHPDIQCDGEILHFRKLSPLFHVKCFAAAAKRPVYGFKLLTYQLRQVQPIPDPRAFLHELHGQGFRFIHLYRDNLLRHALSNIYARQATFHRRREDKPAKYKKLNVVTEEVIKWIRASEQTARFEWEMLQDLPHIDVNYETDLAQAESHGATVAKVCRFLDLPPAEPRTDLVKVTPRAIGDFVANYEELREALEATPYARFLEA